MGKPPQTIAYPERLSWFVAYLGKRSRCVAYMGEKTEKLHIGEVAKIIAYKG